MTTSLLDNVGNESETGGIIASRFTMSKHDKQIAFERCRTSLTRAGIVTAREDSLICPLCWRETSFADLTEEHPVPRSVGGRNKVITLTCGDCNPRHGSTLDAHLSNYQRTRDGFQGIEPFRTSLIVNGHQIAADLSWEKGHKNFRMVGKATNPAAIQGMRSEFAAGNVKQMKFTVYTNYRIENLKTAVLRAGYLVLFRRYGYSYARNDPAQAVRRRIIDQSLKHPDVNSLVVELRDFVPPYDEQHYVAPGSVNDVECYLVIIRLRRRLRRATTSYFGAFMPGPGASDAFFDLMKTRADDDESMRLSIPIVAISS